MSLNYQQKVCFDAAMGGDNLFISGPGGVGKSYVLRAITEEFRQRNTAFRVAASTGVAALNVGGSTIHSLLGTNIKSTVTQAQSLLGTRPFHQACDRLRFISTIIVDEISMLSGDYVEMMNFWLQQVKSSTLPFGGCQMIFCGDFLQLPPVEKGKPPQWKYAFNAPAWEAAKFTVADLYYSFRQEDQTFVNALNIVRFGTYPRDVRKVFRACIGRTLNNPTHLVATNKEANNINFTKLREFEGQEYKTKPRFEIVNAALSRNQEWADDVKEKMIRDSLVDSPLRMKVGVPVLMLKNTVNYVNGNRGVIEQIVVDKTNQINEVVVKLDTGISVKVERVSWEKKDGDGKTEMVMYHFPMRLAWAITIHKSQGLTLDNVEIDLSNGFACGQAYVALSRMKSLEGLSLTDAIDPTIVKADPELVEFYDRAVINRGGNL